jgi:spore coat protein U-like protein
VYDLFMGESTRVGGPAGAARGAAPGPANGVTPQTFAYRARVYSDQTTPPTGIYTDTIVIDIVF